MVDLLNHALLPHNYHLSKSLNEDQAVHVNVVLNLKQLSVPLLNALKNSDFTCYTLFGLLLIIFNLLVNYVNFDYVFYDCV